MESDKDIDGLIRFIKKNKETKILKEVSKSLGNLGEEAILPIIHTIISMENEYYDERKKIKDDDKRVSKFILFYDKKEALYKSFEFMNKETQEYILGLLNHEDQEVRVRALRILEVLKFKEPIEPVVALLEDRNKNVRASAAGVLSEIENENLIKPLLKALNDEYDIVRGNAAYGLRYYKNKELVEPLVELAKDPSQDARWGAAASLGELRDTRAVYQLTKLLDDEDDVVREYAIESLGKTGAMDSFSELERHVKEKDMDIRRMAYMALGRIDKNWAQEIFKKNIRREIDYEPNKEEPKEFIKFMIKGSLFGALFMGPMLYLRGISFADFIGIDPYFGELFTGLALDFIFAFFIFILGFGLIDVLNDIPLRNNIAVEYYGIEMYNKKYYKFLKEKISKRYRITEDNNPTLEISIPDTEGESIMVTISAFFVERKGDSTIGIENFKKLDEGNQQKILQCINDAFVEYTLTPNE
jgi:HEAT repeat protein